LSHTSISELDLEEAMELLFGKPALLACLMGLCFWFLGFFPFLPC
jgi:hypothetical protein